jgi:hypothetical protein
VGCYASGVRRAGAELLGVIWLGAVLGTLSLPWLVSLVVPAVAALPGWLILAWVLAWGWLVWRFAPTIRGTYDRLRGAPYL